jgi:hypothetical protein
MAKKQEYWKTLVLSGKPPRFRDKPIIVQQAFAPIQLRRLRQR